MTRRTEELVTAVGFFILGVTIIIVWTAAVPDWMLFVGYLAVFLAAVFAIRGWHG